MSSIYHHKHPHAAQRPERSRPDQPRQRRSTKGGKSTDQRRAKSFFYRPDQRPGLIILHKHGFLNPVSSYMEQHENNKIVEEDAYIKSAIDKIYETLGCEPVQSLMKRRDNHNK